MSRALGKQWFWKFSPPQLDRMRSQIAAAKGNGLISRYWDTPTWPVTFRYYVSRVLIVNGVGTLNVDGFSSKLYFPLQTRFLGNRLVW